MVNRAEQLWKNWEESQRQLQKIPEIDLESRSNLKFKYDFLRNGLYRIAPNASAREKLYLHVIRTLTDKLQKRLYPNPVVRMLHRMAAFLVDRKLHLRNFDRQRHENMEQLKGQLRASGLNPFADRLENHLDFESTVVNVPALGKLSDGSTLELAMNFEKDELGSYQFDHYRATVTAENGEKTTCSFPSSSKLNINEAINLLQGRAVMKDFQGMDGSISRRWLQLDFKGMDASAEPKIASYTSDHGFDLKKMLTEHTTGLDHYSIVKEKTLQAMEEGNMVGFDLPGKGRYYMQANPSENKVNFFGADKVPLDFDAIKSQVNEIKNQRLPDFKLFPEQKNTHEQQWQIMR